MQVKSGAGEFDISVERVEVRDTVLVLVGKMGIWEAETTIDQREIGHLLRVSLRPSVLGWVLSWPVRELWRRLQNRKPEAG